MVNPENLIGKVIDGRYRLEQHIGSGSFGHVFEASETFLDEDVSRVAVKLVYPGSPVELSAVRREIEGLARLAHDHVIAYRACGPRDDGLSAFVYIVTELAEVSLAELLKTVRPVPEREVRAIARGIGSALAHLHGRGSVHRDVKPENIFRVDGRWKLGDFGFARPVNGSMVQGSCLAGTLVYLAPEALRGQIGPPSDVYALGVTLWECLTGHRASEGSAWSAFADAFAGQRAAVGGAFGDPWDVIVRDCLRTDPGQRCTAASILERLDAPVAASRAPDGSLREAVEGSQQREAGRSEPPGPSAGQDGRGTSVSVPEPPELRSPRSEPWKPAAAVGLALGVALCVSLGLFFYPKQPALPLPHLAAAPRGPVRPPSSGLLHGWRIDLSMAERAWDAGDYGEAERRAKAVIRAGGPSVKALKLLGAGALIRRSPGDGARYYRAALHCNAGDGEAWLGYAACLEKEYQASKARHAYRQALNLAGSNEAIRREAREGVRRTR